MFKEFHEHSSFQESNNTFLVLIPKKSGAEDLGDFRPISLLGGLYKLLAKVLANRLKKVVGKVVSTSQMPLFCKRWALGLSGWGGCGVACLQPNSQFWLMGCLLASFLALRALDKEIPYLLISLSWDEVLDAFIRRAVEGGFLSGSASGLRINLAKSEIIPVGEVEEIEELVVELGCRVGSLPSQYLGLPLGFLIELLICGMGWKREMPKIVARRLEKVQRDFLWGEGNLEGKIHLVNWEVVCTDKEKGGLGLRKLAMLKSLLGKWIWRYACDKDNLWKQVITVKYGQEGLGWRPKKANGAVGVGFGRRFGKNQIALSHCFPYLFVMAVKGVQRYGWDLLHVLRGHRPSLEEDSVIWRQGRNGQFRVKEAYSLLTNPNDTGFPSRSIWVARVPTKVAFFAWEAMGEGAYWIDSKKRVVRALWDIVLGLVDVKWVFPETVKELFNLAGLAWVPPRSIVDIMVIAFKGFENSLRGKTLWQIVCLTLLWMVWQERNNRIF
ncbi:hypothetical protein CK203_086973 [Vitis vinifera]|uniref:Uncharacterized protein n=1 Tax=Vitis vinifera TaxID=29760 RepID=A0A438FKA9_VITVI|nr:hypothetical protein CK203_086973 [Vitis vinifera]